MADDMKPSPPESNEPLSLEEVAPLLRLLDEPSGEVCTAALRALVRLQLRPEVWRKVSRYILEKLDEPALAEKRGIPRAELIAAAAFVPTWEVRQYLRYLAGSASAVDRRAAARALAKARDPAAIPQLLAELSDVAADPDQRWEAGLALASLDVSKAKDAVHRLSMTDNVMELWLLVAIALARAGDEGLLHIVLFTVDDRGFGSRFFFDAQKIDPLPESAHYLLKQFASDESRPSARGIAQTLLDRAEEQPRFEREAQSIDRVIERKAKQLARDWIAKSPFDESGTVSDDIQLLKYVDPKTATQLTSALCRHLADDPHSESALFSIQAGNLVVDIVHSFETPFTPDVPTLFQTYKILGGGRKDQVAWTASRAGLKHLVAGVKGALGAHTKIEQIEAAQLIETGARYAAQDSPPVFGGISTVPDLVPITQLIDAPDFEIRSYPAVFKNLPSDEGPVLSPVRRFGRRMLKIPQLIGSAVASSKKRQVEMVIPISSLGEEEDESEIVNTGFAHRSSAGIPLDGNTPLLTNESYYFWLEVGKPIPGSIETDPTKLPKLPKETRLTVTLFSFEDEMQIVEPEQTGELQVQGNGSVRVSRPADIPEGVGNELGSRRLFFETKTPASAGLFRMRCNIYCEQVLLQSRLITVQVETVVSRVVRQALAKIRPGSKTPDEPALQSVVDYVLSRTFDPVQLAELKPNRLSIMLNDNNDGTQGFHFFGYDGKERLKDSVSIDKEDLKQLVANTRQALNTVSWGKPDEWNEKAYEYRYDDGALNIKRLTNDLAALAITGFRVYDKIADALGNKNKSTLEQITRLSGRFQISLKESANFTIPAAVIYDYNLATDAFLISDGKYTLCPTFEAALKTSDLLENCECFHGKCPVKAEIDEILNKGGLINELGPVICPSGFWGYRHALGLPISIEGASDAPTYISFKKAPAMGVGIATTLKGWPDHEAKLRKLRPDLGWRLESTHTGVLQMLKSTDSHLIYFYCHGGVNPPTKVPYISVGKDEANISPDVFLANKISWKDPRPLVFINGCHTTAITPDIALQFVNPLIRRAAAAGVIGTEITVFEPLASVFAEECLRRFFKGDLIGDAVRGARLTLLKQANPLGLVYVPFVLPSLHLQKTVDALSDASN